MTTKGIIENYDGESGVVRIKFLNKNTLFDGEFIELKMDQEIISENFVNQEEILNELEYFARIKLSFRVLTRIWRRGFIIKFKLITSQNWLLKMKKLLILIKRK